MKKWKCTVCGQLFDGDTPPLPCPVCGAGESAFVQEAPPAPTQWRCGVCGQTFAGSAPPVPCPVCGAGESAFEQQNAAPAPFIHNTDDSFVLIGGGLASLHAARAIRLRNTTASILIVSEENHLPYNRPALSDMVADGLTFSNLLLEEAHYYEAENINLALGTKALSVDMTAKTVKLSDKRDVPYTKLLLATGASSFNPIKSRPGSVPLLVLRTLDDAEALIKKARGKRVLLVGGGILGIEAALALRERGCQVSIVEYAPRILSLQSDEAVSNMLAERLKALGIGIYTSMSVKSVESNGAILSNGAEMATDLVLACMGVRSEVALAVSMGLELSRGIVVDEFMHTSHPDVWAAGDCAEYGGRVLALAGAASAMGGAAGASMAADQSAPYHPFTPATALELPGFSMLGVGDVSGEQVETVLYRNEKNGSYKRLFFQNGLLKGALFVGKSPAAKAVSAVSSASPLSQALSLLSD